MEHDAGIRLLFVCLGNICRSPLAEAVMRRMVEERGLAEWISIDSAGTGAWHAGEPPDQRMRQVALERGVSMDGQRASQLQASDLDHYTHVFVMDKSNLHDTLYLDTEDRNGHKVRLFRELDPVPGDYQVPDPYYGGPGGFENVFGIVERTCAEILDRLAREYSLDPKTQ
jgi:protein-tyrosine phosphatase